jgi:PAS domain S-box-containing protein
MLDAAPVLAVQLVQSQRDPMIVQATRRIEELFGYGQDELQGRPLSVLLPEDVHVAHEAYMEKFVAAPHDRQLGDLADVPCPRGRKKDGTIFHLEIMLTVCIVAANQFGVATIMPQIRSAAELATV